MRLFYVFITILCNLCLLCLQMAKNGYEIVSFVLEIMDYILQNQRLFQLSEAVILRMRINLDQIMNMIWRKNKLQYPEPALPCRQTSRPTQGALEQPNLLI